jgi:hypothetical protein
VAACTGSAFAADPVIQVIHNCPSTGAEVVDVYLNAGANPTIHGLAFREATGLIGLPAGELGEDLELFVHALETSSTSGYVELLAFPGVPDTPAVDIATQGKAVLFADLGYLTFHGYLTVPAEETDVTVGPTGEAPIAAFIAPLNFLDGQAVVVFVSGYLGMAPAFELFVALNDGTVVELPSTVSVENRMWNDVKSGCR